MNNKKIEEYFSELNTLLEKLNSDIPLDEAIMLHKEAEKTIKEAKKLLDKYEGELNIVKDESEIEE